jgi:hypothetical protein
LKVTDVFVNGTSAGCLLPIDETVSTNGVVWKDVLPLALLRHWEIVLGESDLGVRDDLLVGANYVFGVFRFASGEGGGLVGVDITRRADGGCESDHVRSSH